MVDVSAAGVDPFSRPSLQELLHDTWSPLCVSVAEVANDCFSHCWAGDILASDKRKTLGEPLVVLLKELKNLVVILFSFQAFTSCIKIYFQGELINLTNLHQPRFIAQRRIRQGERC